ncbi:MAG: hypothetical protein JSU01_23670 [Bacteroidetes bacterium]|nr:hypothetical protein [Bacteroidota bacterium]
MSFKLPSQLSEDQVESDVSNYLGYVTPIWAKRFRLLSVDEQMTGADKLFNRFVPIYLQFKVSQGLDHDIPILLRFQNKPLANIIKYRKTNHLFGNPILYFQLRRKAPTALDYQHNILCNLNKPPYQYAAYVAPLTLNITEYEKALNKGKLFRFHPFDPFSYKELDAHDSSINKKLMLGLSPFLRYHISIPPHQIVSTHEHHYSYSKNGGDVAWHSGELLNEDLRLSNKWHQILSTFYSNRELGVDIDQYRQFIENFQYDGRKFVKESDSNDNSIRLIQRFAKVLKTEYNIKLIMLVQTKNDE